MAFLQRIPSSSSRILLWVLAATLLHTLFNNYLISASLILSRDNRIADAEKGNEFRLEVQEASKTGEHKSFLSSRDESHTFDRNRKLGVRDVYKVGEPSSQGGNNDRVQQLLDKMKPLKKDQAVLYFDPHYRAAATKFAIKYNKILYSEAWDSAFLKNLQGPTVEETFAANVDIWTTFARRSAGKIFVVGTPGSDDYQSNVVYNIILPVLKRTPAATALFIVNPSDFKDLKLVWTPPKIVDFAPNEYEDITSLDIDLDGQG